MISIGDQSVTPILDSVVRRDPAVLFPSTSPDVWTAHAEMLGADGLIELFVGAYVLHTAGRVILIDAGVGPDGWRAPSGAWIPGGFLLDNLRVAGIAPESITDVVFTHLHPDHIGWSVHRGTAVFSNATYRCHRADWDFFVEQNGEDGTACRLLSPIESRFELWDGSGPLLAGVDLLDAPGHTPGSTVIVISARSGERAVLLGDVVHCPLELVEDELETIGDVDPELALTTRIRIARELEDGRSAIGAGHFPELRFGRLMLGESRRTWVHFT